MSIFRLHNWHKYSLFIIGCATGAYASSALAIEGKLTVPQTPTDFAEVESTINGAITNNLENALCGGWNRSLSVGSTVGQGIARVTGVPGRKIAGNNPLNAVPLGMALKEENFFFPGSEGDTCGLMSACFSGLWNSPRRNPSFYANNGAQHPCERPLDGIRPDDFPSAYATNADRVTYSCGGGQMKDITSDTNFCPTLRANNPTLDGGGGGLIRVPGDPPGILPPETAGGLCQRLNEDWIYSLWRKTYSTLVEVNPGEWQCVPSGWIFEKQGCTTFDDEGINDPPSNTDNYSAPACTDGPWILDSYRYCCTDATLDSAKKNCVACQGDECHKGITAEPIGANLWSTPGLVIDESTWPKYTQEFRSFFRHYLGSYTRNRLNTGGITATKTSNADFDDNQRLNMPVSCFGIWWWDQNDSSNDQENVHNPLTRMAEWPIFRCVISSYYPSGHPLGDKHFFKDNASDPDQMQFTQAGKGSIAGTMQELDSNGDPVPYLDPPVDDPNRTNTDTWMRDLAKGFSLLSEDALNEENQYDITEPMMVPDTVLQRATVQRYVPDKQDIADNLGETDTNSTDVLNAFKVAALSQGALIRSFDDAVTPDNQERILTTWWQNIENQMNAYFTPPTVQLILPPSWSIDLDPLHPLLTPKEVDLDQSTWRNNPEYQPIDIQLELHEDLLGEVANYLEGSLLVQYTPTKIPVVVPTGSAKEFRALAQRWCSLAIEKGETDNCNSVGGDIGTLINRLYEYADRIDQGRVLRAQSMELNGKFLQLHTKIQERLGAWVIQNTEEFLAFQDQWKAREDALPLWREVQAEMWRFHDEVNQPWCMNQRFTAPIYTLLDPWFPRPDPNSADRPIEKDALPGFPNITPQPGVVLDISGMYVGTGSFTLPVIEPLTVKIDMVELGNTSLEGPIPTLPPLPAIPDFTEDFERFIPTLLTGNNTPTTFGNTITLDTHSFTSELNEVKNLLLGMKSTYKTFWDLALIDPDTVDDGTEEDCYWPTVERCNHFEFDLHERFMRLGSRPNVYLKEDFSHAGQFRDSLQNDPYACLDTNFDEYKTWVCQFVSPVETLPKQSWKFEYDGEEKQIETIDAIRLRSYTETLQPPTGSDAAPFSVPRKDIVPSYLIPETIDILPDTL